MKLITSRRLAFVGAVGPALEPLRQRIYQATNALYAGLATARTLRLLPDGRVFSDRTRSKIRGRERGWQHAVEQLVAAGARSPDRTGLAADLHEWLKLELPRVTRPLKHGGNHRYLFPLAKVWCFGPEEALVRHVDEAVRL